LIEVALYAGNPPRRINEFVPGKRSVLADTSHTAVRLAAMLGTSERFLLPK